VLSDLYLGHGVSHMRLTPRFTTRALGPYDEEYGLVNTADFDTITQ
jgi:hypothetical protein